MTQLLAHLVGDYVLQNHHMANKKTTSKAWALLHVLLYGLPFLLLITNPWQWLVIVGTHFVIDHWKLASYWVQFWGTGVEGDLTVWLMHMRGFDLESVDSDGGVAWVRHGLDHDIVPRLKAADPFLRVWLLIIVDNTMHLCINYATLRWLLL